MSKHHTLPPIVYTAPPKPRKTEKRRASIGLLGEPDETTETRESGASGQPMPAFNALPPRDSPEIEGADRKPHHQPGRLSEGTLSVLLQAQELK